MSLIESLRKTQENAEAAARNRALAKYTCSECGKQDLTHQDVQNIAFFLNNDGGCFNTVSQANRMTVCGEECRRKYVLAGNIPYDSLMYGVNIPLLFRDKRMDLWSEEKQNTVNEWLVNNNKRGIYMQGPPGAGKTSMAAAIAYELRKREKSVRFIDSSHLAIAANDRNVDPEKFLTIFQGKEYIIIDELAKHYLTPTAKELLYGLYADAYNQEKILIITSNFTYQEVADHIDERLASRLEGMCNHMAFIGRDKRKAK